MLLAFGVRSSRECRCGVIDGILSLVASVLYDLVDTILSCIVCTLVPCCCAIYLPASGRF